MKAIFRMSVVLLAAAAALAFASAGVAATSTIVVNSSPLAVTVMASPTDVNGAGNGTTSFVRTYDNGTRVTLTAQDLSGSGYRFAGWWVDRAQTTLSRIMVLDVNASHVVEARYQRPRTLTVNSAGLLGVSISTGPGVAGTTPFSQTYLDGTLVSLQAPTPPAGIDWVGWEVDGVLQSPGADPMAVAVTMDSDHDLCARYNASQPATMRRLVVNSEGAQAYISVSPSDASGLNSAYTSFGRLYPDGAHVTLMAPSLISSGYGWAGWYVDGVFVTDQQSVAVTMDANKTATAKYLPDPAVLTVNSEGLFQAGVMTTPNDLYGQGGGFAPFQRTYPANTAVTLQASAPPVGITFAGWLVDGEPVTPPDPMQLTLNMDGHHSVSVCYQPSDTVVGRRLVVNSEGTQGISALVNVSVSDLEGLQDGSTSSFVRTYSDGESLRLTAPDLQSSGYRFIEWQMDGVSASSERILDLDMTANHTATARYARPRTLTVNTNGVLGQNVVVVSPGGWSYNAPFQTSYANGTTVTLRAPDAPPGFSFVGWLLDGAPTAPQPDPMLLVVAMNSDHTAAACFAEASTQNCTLTVNTGGVVGVQNIGVWPSDANGAGSGNAAFQRIYGYGTDVTLTAPLNWQYWWWWGPPRYIFWRWEVDGRFHAEWQNVLSLPMTAHHSATAWYIKDPSVQVNSAGVLGAPVDATPQDSNGTSTGTTTFWLSYPYGESVNLFADDLPGYPFDHWQVGDQNFASGQDAQIDVIGDLTATAHYLQPDWYDVKRLIINSACILGVSMTVTPDLDGAGSGYASLLRLYRNGDAAQVSAPPSVDGWYYYPYYPYYGYWMQLHFRFWTVDGVRQPDGQTTIPVLMGAHHTVTAYYTPPEKLRVNSAGVSSAPVSIYVDNPYSPDQATTSFERVYSSGTTVTLVANEVTGHTFLRWDVDGKAQPAGQTDVAILMDGYHTATAIYEQPASYTTNMLTVNSTGASQVSISVSPADLGSQSSAYTSFQRIYQQGETVSLTAPIEPGYWWDYYRTFRYWTLDGQIQPIGMTTVNVSMTTGRTATAWYAGPRYLSVNAAGLGIYAASVDATPYDLSYQGGGQAPFVRTYRYGTTVTLSANDVAGHTFSRWEVDDLLLPVGQRACEVSMIDHHNVTAWFDVLSAASVRMYSPDGGQTWTCGSQQSIQWSIEGGTAPYAVQLRYSTNGGASFDQVIANLPQAARGAGSYLWTIPNVGSPAVRVQVSIRDSSVPSVMATDSSDGDFTLVACGDRTVWAANASGGPDNNAIVPVLIDESAQVGGAQALLSFDPGVIEVQRVIAPSGWGADFVPVAAGQVRLIAWNPSALPLAGGEAQLWGVEVHVLGQMGAHSDLVVSDIVVSDAQGEPIPAVAGQPGSFTVAPQAHGFSVLVEPVDCQQAGVSPADPMALGLTVGALDTSGNPDPTFSGTITLSTSGGSVEPGQVALSNGIWSGPVHVLGDSSADSPLHVTDGVATGDSRVIAWRTKGDIDGSGAVNILDVMRAINFALGRAVAEPPCALYALWAADMPDSNCQVDGAINILDVMRVVNQALGHESLCAPGGTQAASLAAASVVSTRSKTTATASAVTVSLSPDGRGDWAIRLSQALGVAGVQLEILGYTGEVTAGELIAGTGWQIEAAPYRKGLRVIAFDPSARGLGTEGGVLLRLSRVKGKPKLASVILSDAAGRVLPIQGSGPAR